MSGELIYVPGEEPASAAQPEVLEGVVEGADRNALPETYPGLKILLMGDTGTGKTRSIRTLAAAGLEVFCIFTEPNALNTMLKSEGDKAWEQAIKDKRVHWHVVKPAQPSWAKMIENARMVTNFDIGTLQKQPGLNKAEYAQLLEVYQVCSDFVDQHGVHYGPIENFTPDRHAIVLDSLSGVNILCMLHVVGGKPVRTQPDWGVAMDNELQLLNKLCFGLDAHFVLTSHVVMQVDHLGGGIKQVVNALGQKNAPEVPKYFTDVILAQREGTTWNWSTATNLAATKATSLAWGEKLPPTFVPLIEEWNRRAALAA